MSRNVVRRLGPEDLDVFRTVRLECLRLHPEAFGSDHDEEAAAPRPFWLDRLSSSGTVHLGGFMDGALAGIVGIYADPKRKHSHLATLGAMYVRPQARGSGLADALVTAAIDHARDTGIATVFLTVTQGNDRALALYLRHGFVEYGRLEDTLRTGGRSYGEILMKRVLAPPPAS